MVYQAHVFSVMIASPGDVTEERDVIREAIMNWNIINSKDNGLILQPLGWETDSSPEFGNRAQHFINKQILERTDLLVGVFWTRLGTPTGDYPSGTVEEIQKHASLGKPVMLYFSSKKIDPGMIDYTQYEQLKKFKSECKQLGLIEEYCDLQEFKEKFTRQLALKISSNNYFKIKRRNDNVGRDIGQIGIDPTIVVDPLSDEAKELLVLASQDPNGRIMRLHSNKGLLLSTNQQQFGERGNPRSETLWEAAVQALIDEGYAILIGNSESVKLTAKGFEKADKLTMI